MSITGNQKRVMCSKEENRLRYAFKPFEGDAGPSFSDTETESSGASDSDCDYVSVDVDDPKEETPQTTSTGYTEYSFYERMGITVMHEHDDKARDIIDEFGGTLTSELNFTFLERLKSSTPDDLGSARVADFNENLSYAMPPERGLRTVFLGKNGFLSDNDECLINEFDELLRNVIGKNAESRCKPNGLEYQGSFMRTEGITIPQPPHVDFDWTYFEDSTIHDNVFLAFFPLTKKGCFLQVWREVDDETKKQERGRIIFIPFGTMLMLPCDTIHGGGFRSRSDLYSDFSQPHDGNLRFHLYIACNGTKLPRFQNNRYTMKHNQGRELSEKYIDAPMLHSRKDLLAVFE